jgi:hypothetical protein
MALTEERLAHLEHFLPRLEGSYDAIRNGILELLDEVRRLRVATIHAPTGPWETGTAPKDGTKLLGIWDEQLVVASWQTWPTWPTVHHPDGQPTLEKRDASGWISGEENVLMYGEPTRWARIMPVEANREPRCP